MIESLPVLRPDAARSERTMARCHQRLAARRRKIEARTRTAKTRVIAVERLLVAGVCIAYLIAMAGDLLAVAAQR